MLMIRLSRVGKTKQPSYRLIVSDKTKDPWGKSLEILGYYNPRTNPSTIKLEAERIKYWISKGAQTSATIHNLLVKQKIIKGPKVKADSVKKTKKVTSNS
ncbi:MAG: 30S ribosomal protein S16 [Patescibacteria group bacterium]